MIHITTLDLREFIADEEFYVCQCLEFDIKGIGSSLEKARAQFRTKINDRIASDKVRGIYPLSELKPAPREMWDHYNSAAKNGMNVDKLDLKKRKPDESDSET
jgi:hypothetical protein